MSSVEIPTSSASRRNGSPQSGGGGGRDPGTCASRRLKTNVVAVALVIYDGAFELSDSSTEAALLKLGTWSPLLGVLGILGIQALVSFAIIRHFLVNEREHFHWLKTLVAPLVGGCLMAYFAYLLIHNRGTLAGAGGATFIEVLPWSVLGLFLIGVVAALWYRLRDGARYAAIGRFVHEDA